MPHIGQRIYATQCQPEPLPLASLTSRCYKRIMVQLAGTIMATFPDGIQESAPPPHHTGRNTSATDWTFPPLAGLRRSLLGDQPHPYHRELFLGWEQSLRVRLYYPHGHPSYLGPGINPRPPLHGPLTHDGLRRLPLYDGTSGTHRRSTASRPPPTPGDCIL